MSYDLFMLQEVLKVFEMMFEPGAFLYVHTSACAFHRLCHWSRSTAEDSYLFNLQNK